MKFFKLLSKSLKYNARLNLTREQVTALREASLHRLLHFVYDNRPFYRELYKSYGINKDDLNDIQHRELPSIDKETVMDNFSSIAPENIQFSEVEDFLNRRPGPTALLRDKYHLIHTSGSTGRIGCFIYGPEEWQTIKALALRIFPNFSLFHRRYAFVGAADGNYAGISLFLSPRTGNAAERIFYQPLAVDINRPVEQWVKELNSFQPHILCGYPAAINTLAREQSAGRLQVSPRVIVCGGEPLSEELRSNIIAGFGIIPTDYYATSESLVLGVKPPYTTDFYLFDDENYFEQDNNNGYYLTNLYNCSFPVVKYRMTDRLQLLDEQESSWPHWPFLRARSIAGRSEDLLWLKHSDGTWEFIHPIVFVEFYSPGLKQFQVVRNNPRSITLKAIFSHPGDKELHQKASNRLQEILNTKGLQGIETNIEEVKDILPDPSTGKTPLIIH